MPSLVDVRLGINPVVQNLIYAHKNADLIGLELFPQFPFAYDGGTVPIMSPENNRSYNTEYADGAMVNIGQLQVSRATITMHRHNWTTPVTDGLLEEWMFPNLAPEVWAAQNSMDVILRAHEVHCAAIAMAAVNYNAACTLALAAAWAGVGAGIIANVFAAKNTVAGLIGKKPNVFWCGEDVWQAIQSNTGIQTQAALAKGHTGGATLAPELVTKEAVAAIFGVDKVVVGGYLVGSDALPVVYTYLWADTAGLAYIPKGTSLMEPAFGYTFRPPGYPKPKMGYRMETHHSTLYEVNDRLGPQIVPPRTAATRTDSGFVFTNCI